MIVAVYVIIALALMISKCVAFTQGIKGEHPESESLHGKLNEVDGIHSVKFVMFAGFLAAFLLSLFWIYFVPLGLYKKWKGKRNV